MSSALAVPSGPTRQALHLCGGPQKAGLGRGVKVGFRRGGSPSCDTYCVPCTIPDTSETRRMEQSLERQAIEESQA